MKNIFVDYPHVVAECEARGLVPVLYIDKVNVYILGVAKKASSVRRFMSDDVELIVLDEELKKGNKKQTCFVCTKNQDDALTLFRMRLSFEARVRGIVPSKYVAFEMSGIDASGDFRSQREMPVAIIRGVTESGSTYISAVLDEQLQQLKYGTDTVLMREVGADAVEINLWVKGKTIASNSAILAKKCIYRSLLNNFGQKYDIELLDDRGGKDLKNIHKYLGETKQQQYAQMRLKNMIKTDVAEVDPVCAELGDSGSNPANGVASESENISGTAVMQKL